MEIKQANVLSGIMGAILGALIGSIPWVLMYIFGRMQLSILAIFIAMGSWKGYELCNGKIVQSLPIIIGAISIITVIFVQMIIIPICMMVQEGYGIDLNHFVFLYSFSSFLWAMIKDCGIGVLFTLIGISSVIRDIRNRVTLDTYEAFEEPRDFH